MPASNPRMNTTAPNRSALVGFAIGIVVIHFATNVAHGIAHQHLAIGVNAFQKAFVAAVIVVAPFYAAYLIWKRRMRAGGALLALSMAGALVFGVYYHFILPGPDHVTHINLPISLDMRDIFDVSAVLLALFECLGVLAGARIFSKS
jgi:glucan phosphoethanolaminetransferase (alkaline phosphatase superfamily)